MPYWIRSVYNLHFKYDYTLNTLTIKSFKEINHYHLARWKSGKWSMQQCINRLSRKLNL